jgi:hypothetical protein
LLAKSILCLALGDCLTPDFTDDDGKANCEPSGFAIPVHRTATVFVIVFKVHSPFLAKLK